MSEHFTMNTGAPLSVPKGDAPSTVMLKLKHQTEVRWRLFVLRPLWDRALAHVFWSHHLPLSCTLLRRCSWCLSKSDPGEGGEWPVPRLLFSFRTIRRKSEKTAEILVKSWTLPHDLQELPHYTES